jgi:plasmid maintenance system killer protein
LAESFLKSASDLEREQANKLCKALLLFYKSPRHPSLHFEKLSGRAAAMHSIRVDDNFRVILEGGSTMTFHFVGTHDDAYRFAERIKPAAIRARIGGPEPA